MPPPTPSRQPETARRAQLVNPIVAQAYLRRAAELKLEAWAQVGRLAPAGTDDSPAAA
jgi:hypothetical protein